MNELKQRMGFDKIYVINLARRPDRRIRIESALNYLRLDYEIFDAIDAKKINDSYIQSLGIALIPNYLDPYHKRPLNFGEIGCFLSHYFIWKDVCITQNRSFNFLNFFLIIRWSKMAIKRF